MFTCVRQHSQLRSKNVQRQNAAFRVRSCEQGEEEANEAGTRGDTPPDVRVCYGAWSERRSCFRRETGEKGDMKKWKKDEK